jgi:hypothetical protein
MVADRNDDDVPKKTGTPAIGRVGSSAVARVVDEADDAEDTTASVRFTARARAREASAGGPAVDAEDRTLEPGVSAPRLSGPAGLPDGIRLSPSHGLPVLGRGRDEADPDDESVTAAAPRRLLPEGALPAPGADDDDPHEAPTAVMGSAPIQAAATASAPTQAAVEGSAPPAPSSQRHGTRERASGPRSAVPSVPPPSEPHPASLVERPSGASTPDAVIHAQTDVRPHAKTELAFPPVSLAALETKAPKELRSESPPRTPRYGLLVAGVAAVAVVVPLLLFVTLRQEPGSPGEGVPAELASERERGDELARGKGVRLKSGAVVAASAFASAVASSSSSRASASASAKLGPKVAAPRR